MKPKGRLNKKVIIIVAAFIVVAAISIAIIILNYRGVFDKAPTVTIKPNNTYTETLHVATDWDYKPFSYIENGEYAGLDVEMIAEVANRLQVNLDLTLLDWNDAQAGLMDGTYDIILNMESNAILKDEVMIGTIPTDEKQYVVYGKTRVNYVGELYGKRVAAYNSFDELGMQVITGYSYQEMFEMLLNDELDYVICPIQIGNSFVEKLHAENDIFSSYQVSYMYGCMALKAEDTELCAALNEVIRDLQTEGVIKKLDSKWVVSRYRATSLKDILENNPTIIILIVIFLQMIIIGGIVIGFSSANARKQKAHADELERNLDIINKQNEELKLANEKAEAANVAKTNFLFNMSHDIRTPMNAIIGFTNLAKRHIGEDAVIEDYLGKISTSSELLLDLINNILEMARIEKGKTQIELTPENLPGIMEQTDSVIHGQADEKHQELVFRTNVDHKFVLCDKLKLSLILINIISNAIKYTDNGGHILVTLDETECSKADAAKYIIKVKDDGIGMSEEFQSRIFESFERERNSTVSKITGTGLGMSITKSIVELMGGEISLQSKLGEGSEFTIVLEFAITDEPVKAADVETSDSEAVGAEAAAQTAVQEAEASEVVEVETAAGAVAAAAVTETAAGDAAATETAAADAAGTAATAERKRHILVVDDNEINRIIAVELLKDMGYETNEACDGQEAVEIIKNAAPDEYDLILMDIQMPVMNGYEASKAIRELDSPLSTVTIFALTANAFENDKQDAQEAGMNGHIAKPIDIEALEQTLKELFSE